MEREVADNPEIVISHNPPKGRRHKMKRRGHKRRRKSLNAKMRVRFRGKLRTYKSLTKLLKRKGRSAKKVRQMARKKWRHSRKYHGKTIVGCPRPRKHKSRKHSTRKHSKGRKRKGGHKKRKAHASIIARGRAMAMVWKKHGAELKGIKSPRARMKKAQKFVKRYLKAA